MEGVVLHQSAGSHCETGRSARPYLRPVRVCIQCGRLLPARARRGRPRSSCGALACELALKRERRRAARVRTIVRAGSYAPCGHCARCGYRDSRCRCVVSKRQPGDGA